MPHTRQGTAIVQSNDHGHGRARGSPFLRRRWLQGEPARFPCTSGPKHTAPRRVAAIAVPVFRALDRAFARSRRIAATVAKHPDRSMQRSEPRHPRAPPHASGSIRRHAHRNKTAPRQLARGLCLFAFVLAYCLLPIPHCLPPQTSAGTLPLHFSPGNCLIPSCLATRPVPLALGLRSDTAKSLLGSVSLCLRAAAWASSIVSSAFS